MRSLILWLDDRAFSILVRRKPRFYDAALYAFLYRLTGFLARLK
jgi:hypothetical protein